MKEQPTQSQGKAYEDLCRFFSEEYNLDLLYGEIEDILSATDNFKKTFNQDQTDWKEKAAEEIYLIIADHTVNDKSKTAEIIYWIDNNKHLIK